MIAPVLRNAGGIGIITIAVMRCVIAFAPQVVFDVDPVRVPQVFGHKLCAVCLLI